MDNAFTAGVVPGGLTQHKEIKILICYVLNELSAPLAHAYLLESISTEGLANYFECADAVSDLLEQGHIEQRAEGYVVTDTGRSIAELIAGDIPLTARERALRRAGELLRRQINQKQHKVDIARRDDGYLVRGAITDGDSEVFAVEIYAPNSTHAQNIRRNFIDHGQEIFMEAIEKLTTPVE